MTVTKEMINGGRSGHGCVPWKSENNNIIEVAVIGGESYPGDVSKTVEVYDMKKGVKSN